MLLRFSLCYIFQTELIDKLTIKDVDLIIFSFQFTCQVTAITGVTEVTAGVSEVTGVNRVTGVNGVIGSLGVIGIIGSLVTGHRVTGSLGSSAKSVYAKWDFGIFV